MIKLAALVVVLAACSPAASTPIAPVVVHSGQDTRSTLPAGSYSVAWTSDCSSLELEWAPTSGGPAVPIPVSDPGRGASTIAIPGGEAYLNGAGSCPTGWTVTISPAGAGPS